MRRSCGKGFALIELMIGILVLGLLISVAGPSLIDLISNNRMLSEVYAMRSALNGARTQALSERTFVTICRSQDRASCGDDTVQWTDGFIVFTDYNADSTVNDPNDRIFITRAASPEGYTMTYRGAADPNTPLGSLRFDSRGHATGFDGTFTVCDSRGNTEARGLIVSPGGIIRAALVGPNNPGSDNLADC